MNNLSPILKTRSLSVSIGGKQVCRELNFALRPGERWGMLGLNGVGKTSLLHTLGGTRHGDAGEISLDGAGLAATPRRQIAQRVGTMYQDSDEAFPSSVLEAALIGRHPHLHAWEWESAQDEEIARAALYSVGLSGFEARSTATLSGGERRRLALAALLVQDPQLFLLDEPVNHLDVHHQIAALELLTRLTREQSKALLMVLHDVNLATRYCDYVLLLFGEGETLQGPTRELLTEANLARLYQHPMCRVPTDAGDFFYPM
ncbi:MAG: ABC transporter ATP-binding protein [Burkholderiales bacterium]|nr:ABC transporter ATP-binding protein [Burkholderiales bacterium]